MDEQWDQLPELRQMADNIKDPNLKIPDYYYAPIHAYKDGMLMPPLLSVLLMTVMLFTEYDSERINDVIQRQGTSAGSPPWRRTSGRNS